MRKFIHKYNTIITIENLLKSWQEFLCGKRKRGDMLIFQDRLMDNILKLYNDLKDKKYTHGGYDAFNISDPKPRSIHKASVRDRLLHHLVYRELYGYFDTKFIYDSYSCRVNKGTHKAMDRFEYFYRKVSKNNARTCHILKCDIRKFFANIDHGILKGVLAKHIEDQDVLWLLEKVIDSFYTENKSTIYAMTDMQKIGLPLGNLTSQLLVNIYMNEFDQFIKREIKAKYYIRYADDFVILHEDKKYVEDILVKVSEFLENELKLQLQPGKVFIKTLTSGMDFLGWIHFPHHRILRTSTKRRMMNNIKNKKEKAETIQSYLGMLRHGNTTKLKVEIERITAKNI